MDKVCRKSFEVMNEMFTFNRLTMAKNYNLFAHAHDRPTPTRELWLVQY